MEREKIESILRDYHWMVKEIARLRSVLNDAGENIVRKYGIDSVMPKGNNISDPIHHEVARRGALWKKAERLEKKVLLIQSRISAIEDEREKTVLDCLLDGMSIRGVSTHMGLSHSHIRRIKESIVDQMCTYVPNVPNGDKLHKNKQAC